MSFLQMSDGDGPGEFSYSDVPRVGTYASPLLAAGYDACFECYLSWQGWDKMEDGFETDLKIENMPLCEPVKFECTPDDVKLFCERFPAANVEDVYLEVKEERFLIYSKNLIDRFHGHIKLRDEAVVPTRIKGNPPLILKTETTPQRDQVVPRVFDKAFVDLGTYI